MVLVHDDDLARISGICDINVRKTSYDLVSCCSILQALETLPPDVAEDYLQSSNAEIRTDLCCKCTHISRLVFILTEGM